MIASMKSGKNKRSVPAVAYYRKSTDRQETSIRDQRTAVEEYAKLHGYRIIREYVDEGISGDATEKRFEFQRMVREAAAGEFRAVLCWDQDRFGRFDPIEGGYWIKPLRDVGVVLVTIAQGVIDWGNVAGRLTWTVAQEGKHAYLIDLSRNITRGQISRAKDGVWTTGPAPYGYVIGADGKLELDSPEKVEAVRTAFRMRLEGYGYRAIAKHLNETHVPSPKGMTWRVQSLRNILDRRAYVGDFVFGARHRGKYHTALHGKVVEVGSPEAHNLEPMIIPNTHPAIIDWDTYSAVLAIRQQDRRQAPPATSKTITPLAGLLFCHCGAPMHSCKDRRKSNPTGVRYRCSAYHAGRSCGCCEVQQDVMLEVVRKKIREKVLLGSMERLERAIAKRLDADATRGPEASREVLRREIAKLEKQLDRGAERLLSVSAALVPTLEKKLLEIRHKRDELQQRLRELRAPKPKLCPKEVAQRLWQLDSVFDRADAGTLRRTLGRIVSRIDLRFQRGELYHNKGYRWHVVGGQIQLCSERNQDQ